MSKKHRWLPFLFALIIVFLCLTYLGPPPAVELCALRTVLVMLVWVWLEPPINFKQFQEAGR